MLQLNRLYGYLLASIQYSIVHSTHPMNSVQATKHQQTQSNQHLSPFGSNLSPPLDEVTFVNPEVKSHPQWSCSNATPVGPWALQQERHCAGKAPCFFPPRFQGGAYSQTTN